MDYGRGASPVATRTDGNDLIVSFNTKDAKFHDDDFAGKMLVRRKDGRTTFGFVRLDFTFKALGKMSPTYSGKVQNVKLLGYGDISFEQTNDGLEVILPVSHPNEIAPVLVIAFDPDAPKALTLQEVIDYYQQQADAYAAIASSNTGKPNAVKVATFAQQIDAAKRALASSEEEQAAAKVWYGGRKGR